MAFHISWSPHIPRCNTPPAIMRSMRVPSPGKAQIVAAEPEKPTCYKPD
jgi:hypothetical protein